MKKNAAGVRDLSVKTMNAKNEFKQGNVEERNLFRRKSRQATPKHSGHVKILQATK
jgi:hypothetical protein